MEAPAVSGPEALKVCPGLFIRMNVDMVPAPVTVTDPMNRLMTGRAAQPIYDRLPAMDLTRDGK
jgi:hypothetical protein